MHELITTEEQYKAAKQRMLELNGARFGTPEGIELDSLFMNAHHYECERGDYDKPLPTGLPALWDKCWLWWWETKKKLPLYEKISHAKYWLRAHTYNRYHIINLAKIDSTGKESYRWGWIDATEKLLLANFAVFCDFYENEYPGHVLWQPTVEREIEEIYYWWTEGRFAEQAAVRKLFEEAHVDDDSTWSGKRAKSEEDQQRWLAAHNAYEERPNEMLGRLLAIRGFLWT